MKETPSIECYQSALSHDELELAAYANGQLRLMQAFIAIVNRSDDMLPARSS